MTQNKSNRIVSAGTWIVIQDTLMKGAIGVSILGLGGVIAAILLASDEAVLSATAITVVLPISMMVISFGLEDFRMNGVPYEQKIAKMVRQSK